MRSISDILSLVLGWFNSIIKVVLKPASRRSVVLGVVVDITMSREELFAENAILRHQLAIAVRKSKKKRFAFTRWDRVFLLVVSRFATRWRDTLHVVKPATLIRWHSDGYRLFWKRRSRKLGRAGRPPIAKSTIELIRQMATKNTTWGTRRIYGELLKLGVSVSRTTIQKYLREMSGRGPRGQKWATFVRNHLSQIWACDFVELHDVLFRPLYIFVVIELERRRVIGFSVTRQPGQEWTAQILRNLTPDGQGPRFLIRDNDSKFGTTTDDVMKACGTEVLRFRVWRFVEKRYQHARVWRFVEKRYQHARIWRPRPMLTASASSGVCAESCSIT